MSLSRITRPQRSISPARKAAHSSAGDATTSAPRSSILALTSASPSAPLAAAPRGPGHRSVSVRKLGHYGFGQMSGPLRLLPNHLHRSEKLDIKLF